jgi:hypothetical protein
VCFAAFDIVSVFITAILKTLGLRPNPRKGASPLDPFCEKILYLFSHTESQDKGFLVKGVRGNWFLSRVF